MPHFSRLLREVGFSATGGRTTRFSARVDYLNLFMCTEAILPPPLSSHFSCTAITNMHHIRCDHSPHCTLEQCVRLQRRTPNASSVSSHLERLFDNPKRSAQ